MTDRTKNLLILTFVLACLIGVGIVAAFKSPVLGLDLQGGLEVTLKAKPEPGQEVTEEQMKTAESVIRNRVDALGVSEPEIRREGSDRIVIGLAGVDDPEQAAEVIKTVATLKFLDLEKNLTPVVSRAVSNGQPVPRATLYDLLRAARNTKDNGQVKEWYAFDPKTKKTIAGPEGTEAEIKTAVDALPGAPPANVEYLRVPGGTEVAACDVTRGCPGQTTAGQAGDQLWYLFTLPEDESQILKGTEVDAARQDFDPQTGGPVVTMEFSGKGGDQFESITKQLAQRGKSEAIRAGVAGTPEEANFAQHFAVILDGKLETWPQIDFTRYPNGISGRRAEISGIGSVQEAKDVALVLQTGSLPIKFETLSETQVSATLGEDSLRQGLIAGFIGLLIVMVWLVIFYRVLGLVADLALLVYGALMYGLIVLIPITMTLPGIAGLVLTIGVAADANVVIFERIKEEIRLGKSSRAAISSGYVKGFRTIIDASVVTLITAGVLFLAGTGSVKGFAFTLALGTLVSIFSAVITTRALLGVLAGLKLFSNANMLGASSQKVRWHFDIIGRTKLWFVISGVVMAISAFSLVANGLNLGIDFEGGTRITATLGEPASVEQVREAIQGIDPKIDKAVVQGQGEAVNGDQYTSFKIQTEELEGGGAESTRVIGRLGDDFGGTTNESISEVSASFGSEILDSAILAVIFSLLLIIAYITARFEFKYSLPMIIALLHDLLITVGVYSLTGREVTAATVAAVLTVLGYSLYDTVIIFDRVRENTAALKKASYGQIVNISLWETLTRSLNTSLITLFPILTLLIFGGDTLKDFAFALIIGIASGAYSSIFIAAPALALLKEREPEYRKLRGSDAMVTKATLGTPVGSVGKQAAAPQPAPAAAGAAGGPPATGGPPADPSSNGDPPSADSLTADERAAREAARQRRNQRRNRPHGRAR